MLLSICMPTYNRGPLLAVLVRTILENLPENLQGETEIVISDNKSTDDTAVLLRDSFGNEPRVRICQPERHLPTAEENLCFAVSQCRGEFVWTLGDDDSVERATLETLGRLLDAGSHDFMVFNSRAMTYQGILKTDVQVPCLKPILDIPLLDFVRATGFWYVLAGFSMLVFRRSMADTEEFHRILGIGRIYSHVIWLVSCFHDKRFAFVNEPLVAYRENRYVAEKSDHWEKVSEREGVFDGALWSTAFLRFMDDLVARKIIDRTFLRDIIDRGPERRFYWPDEMLGHFLRGLRSDVVKKKGNVPASEIAYLLDWGTVLWSDNIVLLSLLDEAARAKRASRPVRPNLIDEIAEIHASRIRRNWYDHFHRYDAFDYSVFQHAGKWFAIRHDSLHIAAPLLDAIDFDGHADVVRVADSEQELVAALEALPRRAIVRPESGAALAAQPRHAVLNPEPKGTGGVANWQIVEALAEGFDSRTVARAIRSRDHWRFHEWFRLVRALNKVARRSILKSVGLRR